MSTIQELWRRIKSELPGLEGGVASAAIVILVGLSSFGLGRLSMIEEARKPLEITTFELSSDEPMARAGGEVVASRGGKAYHFPWCPGAQTMKESNKIWFRTERDALEKGYTPASNCPGLGESSADATKRDDQ